MDTSRSGIKCLKSTCEIVFYCIWWLKFCNLYIKQPFPRVVLYKRSVLKNVSKFTDKHKKQSSGGVLSKEKMFLKIQQNSQQNILSGVSFLIKLQAGKQKPTEAATGDALLNKVLLKISQILRDNDLCWSLFLIKLHIWCLQLYQKRL